MTLYNFIPFTGVFTYPIALLLIRFVVASMSEQILLPDIVEVIVIYIIPFIFPIIITVTNLERQKRGQTDFSFASVYGLSNKDIKHSKEYLEAAYPVVPKEYSSIIPKDLVFGKHKGKYVFCPIKKRWF